MSLQQSDGETENEAAEVVKGHIQPPGLPLLPVALSTHSDPQCHVTSRFSLHLPPTGLLMQNF